MALRLGRTVRELEATLGLDEFASWIAFYKLEHFGERRADHRTAWIAMHMAQLWAKNAPKELDKYMPVQYAKPPQTPEEQQAAVLAAFGMTRKDVGWE